VAKSQGVNMDQLLYRLENIPSRARSLLAITLDNLQPTIDFSPIAVENLKDQLTRIFTVISSETDRPISYSKLAKEIRFEADQTEKIEVESELLGLAVLFDQLAIEQIDEEKK